MNSAVGNSLSPYIERIKAAFQTGVQRIEESALFERAVNKYESLDVRQQRQVRYAGVILALAVPLVLILMPVWTSISSRLDLSKIQALTTDMQRFNKDREVVRQPAPRPLGWMALPAGSPEEVEASLTQFLGDIGIGEDILQLSRSGDTVQFSVKELSIKQAVALTHQLDGWYPAIEVIELKMAVNAQEKKLLTLDARVRFDANGSQKLGNVGGGGGGRPGRPRSGGGGGGDSGGGGNNGGGSPGGANGAGGGDFDDFNDLNDSLPPPRPSRPGGGPGTGGGINDDYGDMPAPFEDDL